jgi:hypothetical protein
VVLLDDKDNRVQELDDFGHRTNAFDGHLRDPSGSFNLQKEKRYRLLVQDRYQRGGPRYQYVLSVRPPQPEFFAAAIHSQNPGPGNLTLWRGGTGSVDVIVHQRDGFNGPLTLEAEGLPPGMHAAKSILGIGNSGAFVFWSDEDAPEWTGNIRLFATGQRGEETIRREVRPYYRSSNDNNIGGSQPARQLSAALRDKAPFRLSLEPARVEVVAGQKAELKAVLRRIWPDFQGKLTALPLMFPGNFKMPNAEIAAGANEAAFTLEVQAGTRPGEYTLSLLGQAQVPYHKSPDEKNRPNTLVSLPSLPVTIVVTAAAK